MARRRLRHQGQRKDIGVRPDDASDERTSTQEVVGAAGGAGGPDVATGSQGDGEIRPVDPDMNEVRALSAEILRSLGTHRPVLDYRPRFSTVGVSAAPASIPLRPDSSTARRRQRSVAVALAAVGCAVTAWVLWSHAGAVKQSATTPQLAASTRLVASTQLVAGVAPPAAGAPKAQPASALTTTIAPSLPTAAVAPPEIAAGDAKAPPAAADSSPTSLPADGVEAAKEKRLPARARQLAVGPRRAGRLTDKTAQAASRSVAASPPPDGKATGKAVSASADQAIDALVKVALTTKPGKETATPKEEPERRPAMGRDEIVAGMKPVASKVSECFRRYQQRGTAKVRIEVGARGEVSRATVGGQFAGTETGTCVEKAVKEAAHFPSSPGMRFDYPVPVR